jgi:FkbM family methyltransferase
MGNKLAQLSSMDWRIPEYKRYWFYIKTCRNYMELIHFDRTKKSLKNIVLRNGRLIQFKDVDQAMQIFLEIWYKRNYTRYFSGASPRVVVDIGANIGLFSLLAHKIWPESVIHAYEPDEKNFAILNANFISRNTEEEGNYLHPYSMAVGDTNGELSFYIKKASGWHSLYPGDENETEVVVHATDLPNLVNEVGGRIDFLKMDCEGCEWKTMLTQKELLREAVGYIAMEYHEISQHTLLELTNIFTDTGFHTFSTQPDAWKTGMLYAKNHAYPFS